MNVLVLGSGGREHALAWKLSTSPLVDRIYVLPGNDGIQASLDGECLQGDMNDHRFVLRIVREYGIELVVPGPEIPLAMGIVDFLSNAGVSVVGPQKEAAKLESSKLFAKEFMREFSIPTAVYQSFIDAQTACRTVDKRPLPIVVKADSLAGGKGVVVAQTREEAKKAIVDFMENPSCSVKTKRILLEECLQGKELSAFALCDGKDFKILGYCSDYKRVADGNRGANTGGMGCFGMENWPSPSIRQSIKKIFKSVLDGMRARGFPYKGILFAGLMIDREKVYVIEFNVRLGDPETQILMPLIKNDLLPYLQSCVQGNLGDISRDIKWKENSAVHVVMASKNYPSVDGTPLQTGELIDFPEGFLDVKDKYVFFSGVKKSDKGFINNGGRVLGVTALGEDLPCARKRAYFQMGKIRFKGAHYRSDIGQIY